MQAQSSAARAALNRSKPSLPKATAARAVGNSPVEIWLRSKGTRRQAFYRETSACAWRAMSVAVADKALRLGKMPSGPLAGCDVVSRETNDEPKHPMYAAFAAQARVLAATMDGLQASAGATK